jgi:hypothetical protein
MSEDEAMPEREVQVTLRMPLSVLREMDEAAANWGFSRNQFLIHVFKSFKTTLRLESIDRFVLLHLVRWGPMNYKDKTPSDGILASNAGLTKEGLHKIVEKFVRLGLMAKQTGRTMSQGFSFDVWIGTEKYYVTAKGLLVAQAL